MSSNLESEKKEIYALYDNGGLKIEEEIFDKYVIEKITLEKENLQKLIVYDKNHKNFKYEALAEERPIDGESALENEVLNVSRLNGIGIPAIKCFGYYKNYTIFISELIGQRLDEIEMPITDITYICKIGYHILNIFQFIHEEKNYLHGDIQPKNFAFGTKNSLYFIYLTNFINSGYLGTTRKKLNINEENNVEIYTTNQQFASINELNGKFRKKTDDLESLGYMLLFLLNGHLPWDNIKELDVNIEKRQNLIEEIKNKVKIFNETGEDKIKKPETNFNLPMVLCLYLDKISSNENDPDVNYSDLKNIFSDEYKAQILNSKRKNELKPSKTTKKIDNNKNEIINKNIEKLINYSEDLKFDLEMFFDIDNIKHPEVLKSYKLLKRRSNGSERVSKKGTINFTNSIKSTGTVRGKQETSCCLIY